MKPFGLALIRVFTGIGFLGMLGVTVLFITRGLAMAAISTGALTAIFGYFVYRDIRKLVTSGKTSS